MLVEQIFDRIGKSHDPDPAADDDRDQECDALLKLLKQTGNRTDQPIVDAKGNRHRSSGNAGNDVCDPDHDSLYDIAKKFHDKPP